MPTSEIIFVKYPSGSYYCPV